MRPSIFALVGVTCALSSCGAANESKPSSPPLAATGGVPIAAPVRDAGAARSETADATVFRDEAAPSLTQADRPLHEQARAAFRAGNLHQAKRLLGRLAHAYPEEPLLVAQYDAVTARIEARQSAARTTLQARKLVVPPAPAFAKTATRSGAAKGAPIPKLVKTSEKRNQIVDVEKWFEQNDLSIPEYFVPPKNDFLFADRIRSVTFVARTLDGFAYTEWEPSRRFLAEPLPIEVPPRYGTMPLRKAIASPPYVVAIYGDDVVAVFDQSHTAVGLFDLSTYAHPSADEKRTVVVGQATLTTPEGTTKGNVTKTVHSISLPLTFALAQDGVLFVSHTNLSYAAENQGQNAYVSALDLTSGEPLWRSVPLVANSHDFVVVGGAVVCGYGFTSEPDFVYVLDRATGDVKQKIAVKSGPEYLAQKGNALHVRTYDTDYVFDVR